MEVQEYQKTSDTDSSISFFDEYGWYMLIGGILILCLYEKFIKALCIQLKSVYDEIAYPAKYHKEPDMLKSRLLSQDKCIQLLQEKYNKDAERHKQKVQENQNKKQEELLQRLKHLDGGRRLGSNNNSDNSSLKPEYNPLMGAGPSSSYRPPKRSACSRGGCG